MMIVLVAINPGMTGTGQMALVGDPMGIILSLSRTVTTSGQNTQRSVLGILSNPSSIISLLVFDLLAL